MPLKHIHFHQIDSTNTWAKTHVDQWEPAGVTLVTASGQTAGRGRFNRQWQSPPDVNIYATFCFWMDAQRSDMGQVPQLLALTACQTLEKWGFIPKIKWPNDLLLSNKKVAGILCETIMHAEKRGIVCGIGLNVNMSQDELKLIERPATSLFAEKGKEFELRMILDSLQTIFVSSLDLFIEKGFLHFFPYWRKDRPLKKGKKFISMISAHFWKVSFKRFIPTALWKFFWQTAN